METLGVVKPPLARCAIRSTTFEMRTCTRRANKALTARRRPAVALCLVGVWFSGGCNLDQLMVQDGNVRAATSYRAAHEDTLLALARRFSLGYVEMVAANPGTDPWIPGEGADVVLPTVHLVPKAEPEGIVINLADMRLYFSADPAPRRDPIRSGSDATVLTTPLGVTEIAQEEGSGMAANGADAC